MGGGLPLRPPTSRLFDLLRKVHTYTHIHTHARAHTHTHTHTHTRTSNISPIRLLAPGGVVPPPASKMPLNLPKRASSITSQQSHSTPHTTPPSAPAPTSATTARPHLSTGARGAWGWGAGEGGRAEAGAGPTRGSGGDSSASSRTGVAPVVATPMYESESEVSRPLSNQGHASGRGPSAREGAGVGRFDVFSSPLPTGGQGEVRGSSRIGSAAGAGVVSGVDLFPHPRPAGGRGNGAGSEQERRRTIYSKMEMP